MSRISSQWRRLAIPVSASRCDSRCSVSLACSRRRADFPDQTPYRAEILAGHRGGDFFADGGSCLAAPDGSWVIPPVIGEECVRVASLEHAAVRRERQNFDPSGHYARPDVLRLTVNRERQKSVALTGDPESA